MLHHLSFGVADIHRSAAFYDAALGALGYVRVWGDLEGGVNDQAVGYGRAGGGDKFAIKQRTAAPIAPPPGFHLAFAAADRAAVDRFHAEALRHGGTDNGPPGLRPHYGPDYYAAFVIDPDGYRVEAVINGPQG
jgi:catechol 2,3-dioxygenase-like lactoylglutathione lyase family enzyme